MNAYSLVNVHISGGSPDDLSLEENRADFYGLAGGLQNFGGLFDAISQFL